MMNIASRLARSVVIALLLLAIGFSAGVGLLDSSTSASPATYFVDDSPAQAQRVALEELELTEIERTMAEIYREVSPSVVAISITRGANGFEEGGSGSGFVIDREGHIMTNFHVVQGAEEIIVNFFDGTIVRAEVVGLDPDSDLAIVQVDLPEDRLQPVTFGSVDDLAIGQMVVAIGSPFGQRWTLTSGIISALERTIQGLGSYSIGSAIQTDAPINPGNSGGPLLNLNGEVVGINSQIISRTRSNSGIGFAVPSDLAVRVARELIENGEVDYSFLGITGSDVSLGVIEALDLANNQRGVVISRVEPGTPAAEAGLRNFQVTGQGPNQRVVSADIITAIDGQPLTGISDLISYLARYTLPDDTITMSVLRDGETIELTTTLRSRPRNTPQ